MGSSYTALRKPPSTWGEDILVLLSVAPHPCPASVPNKLTRYVGGGKRSDESSHALILPTQDENAHSRSVMAVLVVDLTTSRNN